jgi:hypothetical protein
MDRHPGVLYPKKMSQKSNVEVVDLYLTDPASNAGKTLLTCGIYTGSQGVIEIAKSLVEMTPTVDPETGRKAKTVCNEDQGETARLQDGCDQAVQGWWSATSGAASTCRGRRTGWPRVTAGWPRRRDGTGKQ